MKNTLVGVAIIAVVALIASPFLVKYKWIDSGNVGVRVIASGSNRGVDKTPIGTGRAWYCPLWEEIHEFPIFEQVVRYSRKEATSFTISSAKSAQIDVDVALTYQLDPERVPEMFSHLRRDIDYISNQWLKTHVRDALSKVAEDMDTMAILGEGKSQLLEDAKKHLNVKLNEYGITVKELTFGDSPKPEAKIQASIDQTIMSEQLAKQAENKVKQSKSEADQEVEKSRGKAEGIKLTAEAELEAAKLEAQGNKLLSESITPELIKYKTMEKWDGILPKFTGQNIPLIDIQSVK